MFSNLFPFPLADNVSHYFTKGSTVQDEKVTILISTLNNIRGNRLLFNNMGKKNKSSEKISLLN